MNSLINYSEFEIDIKNAFKKIIDDFNLILLELQEGRFLLKGLKCNLRFTYDRGDVFCGFLQPEETNLDRSSYNVWTIYRFLYPDDIDNSERVYDPKDQLIEIAALIDKKLRNILFGDFSWLSEFLIKEAYEKKLTKFVLNKLDYNDSITRKFWKGDFTWKQDVEKLIVEKGITL